MSSIGNIVSRQQAHLVVVVAFGGILSGCAGWFASDRDDRGVDDEQSEAVEMEADPVLIRADEDGETEHFNAEEVFESAYYDFQARRYEDAAEHYELIIEHFEGSRFYLPSLYNGGLAFEELDRWEDAADAFRTIIEEFPESDEELNAQFRLARALHELGEYEEAAERLTGLLLRDDLEHFDRMEAHVRRGKSLLELQEWSDAENSFRAAIESNADVTPSKRLDQDHRFMVLAHFGSGRAYHGRMNEISLVLPPERMEQDLEDKADYHERAQTSYIRAIQQHHPYWSVAAGYKVGRLYQDMYIDIFTSEIPDDLTEEELAYYFEELRDKLEVLMERAMSIYERNLSFSRRVAPHEEQTEEWVEETSLHLERMRAFLEDPMVQNRAEKLVLEQGDLEELWDSGYYARQHVDAAVDTAIEQLQNGESPPQQDEEDVDEVARR